MYSTRNIHDIKSATSKSAVYIKNNELEAQASIESFRSHYKAASNEKERQIYLGANARAYQRTLVGSPAFWNARQKECQAIMDSQDIPFNLFYTVSSAEAFDCVVDRILSENLGKESPNKGKNEN